MTAYNTLINSSFSAELAGGTAYKTQWGGGVGMPEATRLFAQRFGADHDPLVAVRHGNRTTDMQVAVKGATQDAAILNARIVYQMLRDVEAYYVSGGAEGDRCYLVEQMEGQTTPAVFEVLGGQVDTSGLFSAPIRNSNSNTVWWGCPAALVLQPWSHPQALTRVTSGAITNGGGTAGSGGTYTLAAAAGDRAAPLRLTVTMGATFRRLMLAKRSRGNVANVLDALEAESTGGTGYTVTDVHSGGNVTSISDQTVAGARGGKVCRVAHGAGGTDTDYALLRWTIDKSRVPDMRGRWRVYLRVDTNGSSTLTYAQLKYGGTDGTDIATKSGKVAAIAGGSSDYLVDLGEVTMPAQAGPADQTAAAFKMTLYCDFAANVANVDLDCLYLIPADEEMVDIELAAASASGDQLLRDSLGIARGLAVLDSSSVMKSVTYTGVYQDNDLTVPPGIATRWFPLLLTSSTSSATLNGHDLTATMTLTFDYQPHYELLIA